MNLSDTQEILEFINQFEREAKAVKEEALRICWWMRGSITYDDAMMLGNQDRSIINKIINENQEASKKTGQLIY